MDEVVVSIGELLDGTRSVSRGIETLRGEHESALLEINGSTDEGINDFDCYLSCSL